MRRRSRARLPRARAIASTRRRSYLTVGTRTRTARGSLPPSRARTRWLCSQPSSRAEAPTPRVSWTPIPSRARPSCCATEAPTAAEVTRPTLHATTSTARRVGPSRRSSPCSTSRAAAKARAPARGTARQASTLCPRSASTLRRVLAVCCWWRLPWLTALATRPSFSARCPSPRARPIRSSCARLTTPTARGREKRETTRGHSVARPPRAATTAPSAAATSTRPRPRATSCCHCATAPPRARASGRARRGHA
mmetsp:Transcript_62069/g.164686  ORF Transcript_62069/g.164686 Transcript_62069/m.164686 type:complete len:252 (-) Transcript_62069:111-866(-)